jgi:hypothetical protein
MVIEMQFLKIHNKEFGGRMLFEVLHGGNDVEGYSIGPRLARTEADNIPYDNDYY